jgi:hypothetical protein
MGCRLANTPGAHDRNGQAWEQPVIVWGYSFPSWLLVLGELGL